MSNEEKCIYCDAFAVFKELSMKYSMEDAFHTVLRAFEDEIIDEAFTDGYTHAMSEIAINASNAIKKALCQCDECDGSCGQ